MNYTLNLWYYGHFLLTIYTGTRVLLRFISGYVWMLNKSGKNPCI